MTLSLVLTILVSTSELQAPATSALQRAAQEVLGSDSEVRVRGYAAPPDDAELSEEGQRADAVAEVIWVDQSHQRALVHLYLQGSHRFVNRELAFDERDEQRERGRMLGFAIASMLPGAEKSEQPEVIPESPYHIEIEDRPPAPDRPRQPITHPMSSIHTVGAVDGTGLSTIAAGIRGIGLGVGIAGRWYFRRSLSLRLATGIRYGDSEVAQAHSSHFFAGLGLAFQFTSPDSNSRFVFGGRADALLSVTTLRRSRVAGEFPESQTRVQPATDLLVEGAWYFLDSTALLAAAGGELRIGHADVVVGGREITDINPLRGVAEFGIRARF